MDNDRACRAKHNLENLYGLYSAEPSLGKSLKVNDKLVEENKDSSKC